MQFRLFGLIVTNNFRITKLEKVVLGVRSNLNNDEHALLIDYDDYPIDMLVNELRFIQKKWRLGDAEIYMSSLKKNYFLSLNMTFPFIRIIHKNVIKYHVYFFQDPMKYIRACEILMDTHCDDAYKRWRLLRKNMVLRISPKSNGQVPTPVMVVESPFKKPDITWYKNWVLRMMMGEKLLAQKNYVDKDELMRGEA